MGDLDRKITASIEKRVNHLTPSPETQRRLREIDSHITEHDQREQNYWNKIENMDERMTALSKKVENLDGGLTRLTDTIERASKGIEVMNALLDTNKVLKWTAAFVAVVAVIFGSLTAFITWIRAMIMG